MSKFEVLEQSISEQGSLANHGYKLKEKIGEGCYATVFLGEFRTKPCVGTVHKVACKVIDTKRVSKNCLLKFLPRELEILVKICHPHIIQTHSIFQRKNKYYIFMRYAENGDLLDFVMNFGPISETQARFWSSQLALAIQYLHNLNIAHRDLKCENILVTANNNIKLCDFGFARYTVNDDNKSVYSKTFCGSLSYAAPEVLKCIPYDPLIADMWSIGVIIFVMLNKAIPFDNDHPLVLYQKQMNRRWKFRNQIVNKLSTAVKEIVSSCLEPIASNRITIENFVNGAWLLKQPGLVHTI